MCNRHTGRDLAGRAEWRAGARKRNGAAVAWSGRQLQLILRGLSGSDGGGGRTARSGGRSEGRIGNGVEGNSLWRTRRIVCDHQIFRTLASTNWVEDDRNRAARSWSNESLAIIV